VRQILILIGLGALLALLPAPATAQDPPPPPPPDTLVARGDTIRPDSLVSPRTAMIRSWLIPGWGQASARAYFRGGVFVAAQGASWYMLVKTMARLAEARAIERARVTWVSDSLRGVIFSDPDGAGAELADPTSLAFQVAIDESERVIGARALVNSRSQQRQDWITGTLFLTLLSGVDAFVAAHLAEAPASLEASTTPGGGVQLSVRVPIGRIR
jgi:hypothetical protein